MPPDPRRLKRLAAPRPGKIAEAASAPEASPQTVAFDPIAQAAPDALLLVDRGSLAVVGANAAAQRVYGLDPAAIPGASDLFGPDASAAIVNGSNGIPLRFAQQAPDGERFVAEMTVAPAAAAGRDLVLVSVRDVTAQVQRERALQQRAEARTRETQALLHASRALTANVALEPLFGSLLEHLHQVIDYQGAALVLFDGAGQMRIVEARRAQDGELVGSAPPEGSLTPIDRTLPFWTRIFAGQGVSVGDVEEEGGLARDLRRQWRQFPREQGAHIRAWIGMPLLVGGAAAGILTVARTTPNSFDDDDIELVRAFAVQASAALANAGHFEQQRLEALRHETLAQVAARFTFVGDLNETLANVSLHVVEATNAVAADIEVPLGEDGDGKPSWASGGYGHVAGFIETCQRMVSDGAVSPTTAAMETQEVQVVRSARELIADLDEWAPLRPLLDHCDWDTLMTIPMVYRGRSIGALNAYFRTDDPPADDALAFLKAVANQAAVGVENTRLFEHTQRSAREYATLAGIAADLTLDRPMVEALNNICESVARGTGAIAANISLLDPGTDELQGISGYGLPPGYIEAARPVTSSEIPGRRQLTEEGRPIALGSLLTVAESIPSLAPLLPFFRQMDANSVAVMPLFARGRAVGSLALFFESNVQPAPDALRFYSAVANQVTAAIDNKQLYEQMERSARESAALAAIAANITLGQPVRSTLDTVANSVVLATSAVTCTVSIADPVTGVMVMGGAAGVPEGFVEIAGVMANRPDSRRNTAIARGEPIVEHNVRETLLKDPAFAPLYDHIREAAWDTVVSLPVSYGGKYVGVVQVGYEGDREPPDAEWKLLAAIADQLAVAIENARLFLSAERNVAENAALAEIARNVTLDQPMRATLDAIAANVVAATQGIATAVFLVDNSADRIILSGGVGLPRALIDRVEQRLPASALFTVEAFGSGEQIFVDDARGKMLRNPVFRAIYAELETVTWEHIQVVPIMFRGEPVGALYVAYEASGGPNEDERQLLDAIANQAAVAIKNVRLFQETEARTRELSTLLDLSKAASATLEMQPLIDTVLARIREVIPSSAVSISTFDPDGFITILGQDADDDMRITMGIRTRYGEGTPLGERLQAGRPIIIPDLAEDTPAAQALRRKVGESDPEVWALIRSWMAVPLVSKGQTVGALFFSDRLPNCFDEHQAELALAFAAQATAALENARLFEERARRVGDLEALTSIAETLTLLQPIETTLDQLVGRVVASTNAIACSVALINSDDGVAMITQHGLPDGYAEGIDAVYRAPATRAQALAFNQQPPPGTFIRTRERLLQSPEFEPAWEGLRKATFDQCLTMPLRFQNRGLGTLNAYYAPGYTVDDRDINLIRAIADQAAVAVESSKLFNDAERRAREQAALATISAELSAERSLQDVLDTLARTAVERAGAEAASVILFGENDPVPVGVGRAGLPEGYIDSIIESRRQNPHVWQELDNATEISVLEHASDFLRSGARYQPIRAYAGSVSWDSVVRVPFVYRERTRGMLNLYLRRSTTPPREDLEFYAAIADRASAAIESARLFADAERRAREQAALAAVSSALTYDRPLSEALTALANTVVAETGIVGVAVIVYQAGAVPVAAGVAGLPPGYLGAINEGMRKDPEFWRAMESRTDVHVIDNARHRIENEPEWWMLQRFLPLNWDSVVRLPFRFRDRTYGMLNLFLEGSSHPPEEDMAFYRSIADRLSVAVDNARLFAEVQARTQQLTALYRADEELHRSLKLDDVLGSLLTLVVEMINIDGAAFQLWEPGEPEPRLLTAGLGSDRASERVVSSLVAEGREAFARAAVERLDNVLAVEDTVNDPRAAKDRTANLGLRSVIDIGIMAGDDVYGKLTGYNLERRRFSEDDRRLFTSLARRAALAIENARLFEQSQRQTQQLSALYRADEELHRSLQLDEVLQGLISTVRDTFGADGVAAVVWEPDDMRPRFIPYGRMDEADLERVVTSLVELGRENYIAARTGVRAFEDTSLLPPDVRKRNYDVGVRALIEAPLRANGKVIGHVGVSYGAPRRFSQEEQRLLGALALRAEVAIDNARLYGSAQELAAVEERQRLARELHDSVSQALYGIALGARTARTLLDRSPEQAVEPVDYVLSLAEAGLAEMRALIFELRPESLEQEGLVAAIEKQVASTRARYGVAVDADLCDEPDMPLNVKEAFYRVAQEALHNVVKHARATHVDLVLCAGEEGAFLDLRDDGVGFDPSGDFPGHLGLRSMRERVTRIGGTFEIESAPGQGAHLRAEISSAVWT